MKIFRLNLYLSIIYFVVFISCGDNNYNQAKRSQNSKNKNITNTSNITSIKDTLKLDKDSTSLNGNFLIKMFCKNKYEDTKYIYFEVTDFFARKEAIFCPDQQISRLILIGNYKNISVDIVNIYTNEIVFKKQNLIIKDKLIFSRKDIKLEYSDYIITVKNNDEILFSGKIDFEPCAC
jgi:hypothetical protein